MEKPAAAFVQVIPLKGVTPKQFLVIVVGIVQQLGWHITYVSNSGLIAFTDPESTHRNIKVVIRIEGFIAKLSSESDHEAGEAFLERRKVIADFTNLLYDSNYTYSSKELADRYEALRPHLTPPEEDILCVAPISPKQSMKELFAFLKPKEGCFVTPLLILLNMAVFALLLLFNHTGYPDPEVLIRWGANFRPATLNGQGWRLLTSCFLHFDVMHLAMNMLVLYFIGYYLEPYLGKARFTAAYLLTGIMGSTLSLYWHDYAPSAGASGAIFGMYGVFLALLTTNHIEPLTRTRLLRSIILFVVYNLLGGIKGNTDNAAHIGGLVSGMSIGYCFYFDFGKRDKVRTPYKLIGLLTFFVLATSFILYKILPRDIVKYDDKMKVFAFNQQTAIKAGKMPDTYSKEKKLSLLKDSGIYYWKENLKLLNEMKQLNVSNELKERTDVLSDQCLLWLKEYDLMYREINENNSRYKDSIDYYDNQILMSMLYPHRK